MSVLSLEELLQTIPRLIERLQMFRRHGVHILGSFIFGLPSDRPATFDMCVSVAQRSDVAFAQFAMLQPLPGTLDFLPTRVNVAVETQDDGSEQVTEVVSVG